MPVDNRAERLAHRPGTPYEGDKPYIFVSYRHSSWRRIYPIIERLIREGYRVWYDEGIEAGMEWQDVIQDHLERCAIFLPMVCSEFCESANCRDECRIAKEDGKAIVPVFLDDVRPTHGMRLVLGVQSIYKCRIPEDELFYERLFDFNASVIGVTLGEKPSSRMPKHFHDSSRSPASATRQEVQKPKAEPSRQVPSPPKVEHANTIFERGLQLYQGNGVPQNRAEAARLFRTAAERGHARAQFNLGFMLSRGVGVEQDAAEATRWYRAAAEQGDTAAQYNLATMFESGRGVPRDEAQAAMWYLKAAERGHAGAQCNLGYLLRNGKGVKRDDAQAAQWLRKAAEQGNASAQVGLGWMLERGRGVSASAAQAADWYRKAAEQGNADAQYNLGLMLRDGRGVVRDATAAATWLQASAQQGNEEAAQALERLRST